MVWGTGILKGMAVTMKNTLRKPVTLRYPDVKMELPERARWALVALNNDDGSVRCTACTNCVRACPDNVLTLDFETREDKSKHITRLEYEVGACMFCGLCVEACPFSAIEMGKNYELATWDVAGLSYPIIEDVDAASPKRKKDSEGGDADA